MIAVDTNVLVYAHRRDSEFHRAAAAKVRELAESRAPWALPWPCLHEFLWTADRDFSRFPRLRTVNPLI